MVASGTMSVYHSQQGHPDYRLGAYIGRSFPATIAQTWPAQPSRRGFVISGKHCGLMTTLGQLADFAHPQPVAEPGPPLGKAYRGQLSRRQAYVGGEKLLLRPILAGIFAIGQACNASVLHLDEKIGAVTFAIKHHGKTMKQRISPKLVRAWLVRHIIFKARDDVAFQHLQQAWIDGLAHHK